jgi:hypothetical protein
MLRLSRDFGKREKFAAVRRDVVRLKPLPVLDGERSELARNGSSGSEKALFQMQKWHSPERALDPDLQERASLVSTPQGRGEGED